MIEEVNAAVVFLAKFLQRKLSKDSLEQFKQTLTEKLKVHYKDHWFPELPNKGSGYRCIRINNQVMDPILYSSAEELGVPSTLRLFPDELTMWVDPQDVSYRIGENGSIGQVEVNVADKPTPTIIRSKSPEYSTIGSSSSYLENPRRILSSCKDQFVRGFSSSHHGHPVIGLTQYAAFAS